MRNNNTYYYWLIIVFERSSCAAKWVNLIKLGRAIKSNLCCCAGAIKSNLCCALAIKSIWQSAGKEFEPLLRACRNLPHLCSKKWRTFAIDFITWPGRDVEQIQPVDKATSSTLPGFTLLQGRVLQSDYTTTRLESNEKQIKLVQKATSSTGICLT